VFFDEKHTVRNVEIVDRTNDEANITVIVNWRSTWWKAPATTSNRIDLEATQTWRLRSCSSTKNAFALEIVDYRMEDPKYALGSAKLPPPVPRNIYELISLNERIGEAERMTDADFLKSILSDNLRFRRANGTIVDKAIYLDDLMKPGNTTDELHSTNIIPTIYGNLAVVELLVAMRGMRCGNKLDGVFRNIRIFLNEPDKEPHWQLHSWFNVRVPEAR
jgi:hypothetical protein